MTSQTTPERDGQLIKAEEGAAVRFARVLAHSPERVWRAITDREELRRWFPALIEGELETEGAELSFPFPHGEGPTEPGQVLTVDPPKLLAYTWGEQELRFELEPVGDGCRLTFTHTLPLEETANVAAGWHACLDELAALVDGRPAADPEEDRWSDLHEGYAEDFGVDPEVGRRAIESYKEAVESHRASKG